MWHQPDAGRGSCTRRIIRIQTSQARRRPSRGGRTQPSRGAFSDKTSVPQPSHDRQVYVNVPRSPCSAFEERFLRRATPTTFTKLRFTPQPFAKNRSISCESKSSIPGRLGVSTHLLSFGIDHASRRYRRRHEFASEGESRRARSAGRRRGRPPTGSKSRQEGGGSAIPP
jgi:hypothetical protein